MRDWELEGRAYRKGRRDTFRRWHLGDRFTVHSSESGEEPMAACWVAARLIQFAVQLGEVHAELDECQAGNCCFGKRATSFVIGCPASFFSSLWKRSLRCFVCQLKSHDECYRPKVSPNQPFLYERMISPWSTLMASTL
jgi:hypothetical protein